MPCDTVHVTIFNLLENKENKNLARVMYTPPRLYPLSTRLMTRTKLFRSITGLTLAALAGLVMAPTYVTAGFLPSQKKSASTELAAEAPVAPSLPTEPALWKPQPTGPVSGAPTRPAPAPQPGAPSDAHPGHGQPSFNGPTTFAVEDFAPQPVADL